MHTVYGCPPAFKDTMMDNTALFENYVGRYCPSHLSNVRENPFPPFMTCYPQGSYHVVNPFRKIEKRPCVEKMN
jgi:hypothetical protein